MDFPGMKADGSRPWRPTVSLDKMQSLLRRTGIIPRSLRMERYKAVIFDLDGVLVDTEGEPWNRDQPLSWCIPQQFGHLPVGARTEMITLMPWLKYHSTWLILAPLRCHSRHALLNIPLKTVFATNCDILLKWRFPKVNLPQFSPVGGMLGHKFGRPPVSGLLSSSDRTVFSGPANFIGELQVGMPSWVLNLPCSMNITCSMNIPWIFRDIQYFARYYTIIYSLVNSHRSWKRLVFGRNSPSNPRCGRVYVEGMTTLLTFLKDNWNHGRKTGLVRGALGGTVKFFPERCLELLEATVKNHSNGTFLGPCQNTIIIWYHIIYIYIGPGLTPGTPPPWW